MENANVYLCHDVCFNWILHYWHTNFYALVIDFYNIANCCLFVLATMCHLDISIWNESSGNLTIFPFKWLWPSIYEYEHRPSSQSKPFKNPSIPRQDVIVPSRSQEHGANQCLTMLYIFMHVIVFCNGATYVNRMFHVHVYVQIRYDISNAHIAWGIHYCCTHNSSPERRYS